MMSNCPDILMLNRLLAGNLTPDQEQPVSEHLDKCARCQQRLEHAAAGDRTLRAVTRNLRGSVELTQALKQVIHKCTSDPAILVSAAEYSDEGEISVDSAIQIAVPQLRHGDSMDTSSSTHEGKTGSIGPIGPGSRLRDYEILAEVGRGGMGVVWKARDLRLNRLVALKVLDGQVMADATARQRFLREARAVFAVNHPNVVKMFWIEESPVPYLVMEYVDGPSLRSHLAKRGALDLPTVLRIGQQIASGLAASHQRGITHRDIKPGNIVLDIASGQAKLTDFGLAQIEGDSRLTVNGCVAGTPAYMSPEQATGDEVDHRSDLFSLGSVLYTMATGQSPFDDERTMEALDRVCTTEPVAPQSINPGISSALADLIQRLHAKHRDDRPRTAAEVAGILEQQLADFLRPGSTVARAQATIRQSVKGPDDTQPLPIIEEAVNTPAASDVRADLRSGETEASASHRIGTARVAMIAIGIAGLVGLGVLISSRLIPM